MAEWNPRANAVFLQAVEVSDPAARAALLDRACGGDAALRRAVETLLAAHAAAGSFLADPHPAAAPPADQPDRTADLPPDDPTRTRPGGGTTADLPPPADVAGAVIAGRYKLLEQIGEGGMGTVWVAAQTEPVKRRVAVKLVRADRGQSRTILARFAAERQAIAVMDHPHIAKLLDAGTTEAGAPYFVMELVRGVPLTEFCDAHRLTVPDRLALFQQVCSAVQHAHQKGVIHRDLKPSNVLVESHDGKPVPKVIDFGLAKAVGPVPLADESVYTAFGSVLGTPLYMAPEQATFNAVDIDTRADVYALGVILYELLTGTTPITRETLRKAAFDEVLRVIREQEPAAPSHRLSTAESAPAAAAARQTEPAKLGRLVRGELDWIVLKALAKDRDRRYETALGLARDVERFLNREPVAAGPPTAGYKLRKFVARNRGPVAAAGVVLLALVVGAAGTTWGMVRAEAARRDAEAARLAEADRAEAERRAREEAEAARRAEGEQRQAAEDSAWRANRQRERAEDARREAQAEKKRADERAAAATAAREFLQAVLVQGNPRQATKDRLADPNRTLRSALDFAAKEIEGRFADQPEIAASLRETIGRAYLNLGARAAAGGHLAAALALRERALGPDHPDTLNSVNNLGILYQATGDYRAAEPLLVRALAGKEKALGPDHPDTLIGVNNLGELYREKGDRRAAEPLLKQVLARREKALGPGHPDTLTSVNNLGILYQATGDYRRAEPLLVRALAGTEMALGPDHPNTLRMAVNLGTVYLDTGEYERSEPLLKRALAGWEKVLGPDHPDTLTAANNLGMLYRAVHDHRRAEPLLVRALAGWEKALGPGHPLTLTSVNNLGVVLTETGRAAEAVPLHERAYAARAGYPAQLAEAGDDLIAAYAAAGRPADAARVVGEMLAEGRARVKPGSPELGGLLAQSGKLLLNLDPAAAEPVLRECLELREKLAPVAWNTANAKSLLGDAQLRRGKPAEAEPLLVAGYAGLLADRANIPPLPQAQANLPEAADRLVEVYVALGKPDEVRKWRAERAKYPYVAPPPRPAK